MYSVSLAVCEYLIVGGVGTDFETKISPKFELIQPEIVYPTRYNLLEPIFNKLRLYTVESNTCASGVTLG